MESLQAFIVLSTIQLHLVTGCLQLNGQDTTFPATTPEASPAVNQGLSSREHGIAPSLQFSCSGTVSAWNAYFEDTGRSFVRFQVWRPADTDVDCPSGTYTLVGTNSFNDFTIDGTLRGRFVSPLDDVIRVQPGDVVGFYVEVRNKRRVSFQTWSSVTGAVSYTSTNIVRRSNLLQITSLNTCSNSLTARSNIVPIISADVTVDVTTRMAVFTSTSAPVSMSSTTAPPLTASTASPLTASIAPPSTASTTTLTTSPVRTELEVMTTSPTSAPPSRGTGVPTDSTGALTGSDSVSDGQNLGTESPSPRDNDAIPLTTLILAVVVAVVVSTAVVITAIIIFRCVWVRLYKRKRLDPLNQLRTGVHNPQTGDHIYSQCEMDTIHSADKLSTEMSKVGDYEVPISTLRPLPPPSAQNQSSSTKRPLPTLEQDLENTYEVPINSQKTANDCKLTSNEYELPPLPAESDYTFMSPRSAPAPLQENVYCNTDGSELRDDLHDGLTESNIYEPLPF